MAAANNPSPDINTMLRRSNSGTVNHRAKLTQDVTVPRSWPRDACYQIANAWDTEV
ncbi:hypothetical protein MSAR_26080 [Mycolicibacterium sarraceniae]|uniref:Uncharacterized protein n=1 Tax=Mycolicibacterium sarraceniae TaxID=1534348 RepID=A0A7I7SR57_9MYCO|nr:hypothetical protein MSAR_26080 [Mycolicibacterium sarraceniae]